jgi:hypothetical protein
MQAKSAVNSFCRKDFLCSDEGEERGRRTREETEGGDEGGEHDRTAAVKIKRSIFDRTG